eukprot:TRINITY_DN1556_c0_g1_i3.p1 TRINITY_DN1556_c0_g1~~TRINITY_DN1556_c0_g1_i3.p1  ORF type:complete len:1065 (+),score=486.32 TRINITY_DN1556_c0_g1_i3:120-3314(+)
MSSEGLPMETTSSTTTQTNEGRTTANSNLNLNPAEAIVAVDAQEFVPRNKKQQKENTTSTPPTPSTPSTPPTFSQTINVNSASVVSSTSSVSSDASVLGEIKFDSAEFKPKSKPLPIVQSLSAQDFTPKKVKQINANDIPSSSPFDVSSVVEAKEFIPSERLKTKAIEKEHNITTHSGEPKHIKQNEVDTKKLTIVKRDEKERLEKEKQEKERAEKERIEKEKIEKEKAEKEKMRKEKAEKREREEKARLEKERIAKERAEKERLEKERIERERLEKEKIEKEKQEKERIEKERIEKERIEKERIEKERIEKERIEKERIEKEKIEKEKIEKERIEKERLEEERLAKERLEMEKAELERLEKEKENSPPPESKKPISYSHELLYSRKTSAILVPIPQTLSRLIELPVQKSITLWKPAKKSDFEKKSSQINCILNKLTDSTFNELQEDLLKVKIDSIELFNNMIGNIFSKAVMEAKFAELYALFCKHYSEKVVVDVSGKQVIDDLLVEPGPGKKLFRRLLLAKCQSEFESTKWRDHSSLDSLPPNEKAEKIFILRKQFLGTVRFIGELFKVGLVARSSIHEIIQSLLSVADEYNVEAVYHLFTMTGPFLETDQESARVIDIYSNRMQEFVSKSLIPNRVRFMLQDAIYLRKNKWSGKKGTGMIHSIQKEVLKPENSPKPLLNREDNKVSPAVPRKTPQAGGVARLMKDESEASQIVRSPSVNQNAPPEHLKHNVKELVEEFLSGEEEDTFESFAEFHVSNMPVVVEGIAEHLTTESERNIKKGAQLLVELVHRDVLDSLQLKKGLSSFLRNANESELDCPEKRVVEISSILLAQCVHSKKLQFDAIDELLDPLLSSETIINKIEGPSGVAIVVLGNLLKNLVALSGMEATIKMLESSHMEIHRYLPKEKSSDEDYVNFLKIYGISDLAPRVTKRLALTTQLETLISSEEFSCSDAQLENVDSIVSQLNAMYPEALEDATSKWVARSVERLLQRDAQNDINTCVLLCCVGVRLSRSCAALLPLIRNAIKEAVAKDQRFQPALSLQFLSEVSEKETEKETEKEKEIL